MVNNLAAESVAIRTRTRDARVTTVHTQERYPVVLGGRGTENKIQEKKTMQGIGNKKSSSRQVDIYESQEKKGNTGWFPIFQKDWDDLILAKLDACVNFPGRQSRKLAWWGRQLAAQSVRRDRVQHMPHYQTASREN
jgi:hypothetical protein